MTQKEVQSKLKENGLTWRMFNEWMFGQTCGLNEDGTLDYYEWDVERFVRNYSTNK